MAADVGERAKLAGAVARHQDRRRPEAIGKVVAGLRNPATESRDKRIVAEKNLSSRRACSGEVYAAGLLRVNALVIERRAALDRIEGLANQSNLDTMLHELHR